MSSDYIAGIETGPTGALTTLRGIETGPTGFCSLLSITRCARSTIPDAGPGDATSGGA